jgi:hypothetical protein
MKSNRILGYEHRGGRRIVIRETDDYLEQHHDQDQPQPRSPWIRDLFQPGVIGVMIACIAWSVLQLTRAFGAAWSPTLILLTPIITALIGCASQRAVQERYLSSTESLRFRLVELLVILILTKVFSYLDETPAQVWAEIRTWSSDPAAFFDGETMTVYLLGVGSWLAAGATMRDLDAVSDPTRYVGEDDPMHRLSRRFFIGGFVLLFFTGLARVSLSALVRLDHSRVRGLIGNVLLYFVLGLVMLGQLRFTRLSALWQRERVHMTDSLSRTWLRYSLLILGGAALVALLLPTGYTLPLLDLVTVLFFILVYVAGLLYFLLSWPIGLLLSWLLGRQEQAPRPPTRPIPFEPLQPEAAGPAPPWLTILRSFLFWGLVLGGLAYLLRIYLRDRPDMGHGINRALRSATPVKWLRHLWRALQRWWIGLRQGVETRIPEFVRFLRRRSPDEERQPIGRSKGENLKDRIFYHYFTILDRARAEGLERRGDQTPYEYERTLMTEISSEMEALEDLTDTFVVARYSAHPISGEMVRRADKNAREIQAALKRHAEERGSQESS